MFGRVIANRYRLTNRLGVGGMGSVWRAEHLTLGSQVAIKLIDELIASNAEIRERFEREAKAAASLRSPHVVQVLDYGVDEGTPYIAMELLEGESLDDRLTREVKLSPRDTLRIITDVARAVGKAHEAGITHRDLKPANIFLVKNDDAEMAKVLDFGVAKQSATAGRATQTGAMIGTPAYMSPEQAQGTKSVDPRTDLWALGAITFECLCGRLVFTSEAMGELILHICTKPLPIPSQEADLPEAFDAWFARALERDPDARFQSARELIDGLRAALADLPSGDNAERAGPHPGEPTHDAGAERTSGARRHVRPLGSRRGADGRQRALEDGRVVHVLGSDPDVPPLTPGARPRDRSPRRRRRRIPRVALPLGCHPERRAEARPGEGGIRGVERDCPDGRCSATDCPDTDCSATDCSATVAALRRDGQRERRRDERGLRGRRHAFRGAATTLATDHPTRDVSARRGAACPHVAEARAAASDTGRQ